MWYEEAISIAYEHIKRCDCPYPRTCDCCWAFKKKSMMVEHKGRVVNVRRLLLNVKNVVITTCGERYCCRLKHMRIDYELPCISRSLPETKRRLDNVMRQVLDQSP